MVLPLLVLDELALERRGDPSEPAPLSFAQEQIWLAEQLAPASTAYLVHSAFELQGRLNHPALEQAFVEITRRHEILRTAYMAMGSEPRQTVRPLAWRDLPVMDLSGLQPEERERIRTRLARQEARRPFVLRSGQLIRWCLVRSPANSFVMISIHHLCTDGWSSAIFTRELNAIYRLWRAGQPSSLAEPRVQYADFAVWQRRHLSGTTFSRLTDYWLSRLGGAPSETTLPGGNAQRRASSLGRRETMLLDVELVRRTRQLARRARASMFMVLLAVFEVVLYRYLWRGDLVVGTPMAGRTRVEVEEIIGFFVNPLALRTHLDGRMSFLDVVSHVYDVTLDAYEHQEMPFDKLISALKVTRVEGQNPLFQIFFSLNNNATQTVSLPDVTVRPRRLGNENTKFDLEMSLIDVGGAMQATIHYKRDYFALKQITDFLERFRRCLAAVVENSDQRILDIDLDGTAAVPSPPLRLPSFAFERSRR